jgi:hypothetical protein
MHFIIKYNKSYIHVVYKPYTKVKKKKKKNKCKNQAVSIIDSVKKEGTRPYLTNP